MGVTICISILSFDIKGIYVHIRIFVYMCVYILFSFFSDIDPWMKLMDQMIVLLSGIWGTSIPFSIVAASIYIFTNTVLWLLLFFHICTNILLFIDFLMIVILTCLSWYLIVLELHFFDAYWSWTSFHVLIGPLYIFLEKNVSSSPCLFFNQVVWLLSHKKEWNSVIYNNTDGPRGYYASWNKSDSKRQTVYIFTYIWNLRQNNNNDSTKQKQAHRYRE